METRTLTCIKCPRGCQIEVVLGDDGAIASISGNSCKRGEVYARAETTNPVRTVTTTVPVTGSSLESVISVKTASDVPKARVLDVVAALSGVVAKAPVAIGDIVAKDVAGTGVDVVATKRA